MADTKLSDVASVPSAADLTDGDTIIVTDYDAVPKKTYKITVAQARTLFAVPSSDNSGSVGGSAKRWATLYAVKAFFDKIIGGASGLVWRNHADAADLMTLSDAGNLVVTGTVVGDSFTGQVIGNADTATKLATPRDINGEPFDGTQDITITAAVGAATTSLLGGGKLKFTETDFSGGDAGNPLFLNERAQLVKVAALDVAESAGTATSTGMTQAIGSGETWKLKWNLSFASDGNANGVSIALTIPTFSHLLWRAVFNTSGPTDTSRLSGSTNTLTAVNPGTYDTSSVVVHASLELEVTIIATSAVTADLKFNRAVSGTQTLKAGSTLVARRIA